VEPLTLDRALAEGVQEYGRLGFTLVCQLIAPEECARLAGHFDAVHADPPRPLYDPKPVQEAGGDPLQVYPRVMHPHRFDALSLQYLLDGRILEVLRALMGEEPLAAQSMFYFKPPGARGQALHQDNFYLRVEPGTCAAAWLAVDRCDAENGALQVVPNTGDLEIACPQQADLSQSFGGHYVPPPPGQEPQLVEMEPGDVLFFNGNVVHGSLPNRSRDRFRRTFIGHYVAASARQAARFYHPLLNARGEEVEMAVATGGGPCGENPH
jgi:hypothetical protein